MNKIKVGYLIDDGEQPWNVVDLVNRSSKTNRYTISHLIIQQVSNNEKKPILKKVLIYFKKNGILKLFNRIFFQLIFLIEYLVLLKDGNLKKIYKKYSLNDIDIPRIYVKAKISESGLIHTFDEDELDKIRGLGLDLIIRGGTGILRGEILSLSDFGIISFHHGDIEINRGGPPGFWEVLEREPTTGFTIQKIDDELDNGKILFKGLIPTSSSYVRNRALLYRKANIFMHIYLNNLSGKQELENANKSIIYDRILYKIPNSKKMCRYIYQNIIFFGTKFFKKVSFNKNEWSIAFQLVNNWKEVSLRNSKRVINNKKSYYADPFVIQHQKRNICFVEEFDNKKKKGKISAIEIYNQSDYSKLGTVLEENFHLSYPYVFKVNDEIFMCPESSKSQDIRIYKCNEFPMKWSLHKIIMNDVSAVDSNIIYHNKLWWLFTNLDTAGIGEHNSELHVFYANDFDSTDWKPHKMNPIIFDSTKSRNAGAIIDNGDLFRVHQRHDFDQYGKSIGINQIIELSPDIYREINIKKVEPKFFEGQTRTHTLSFQNGLLALDSYGKGSRNRTRN
jgi:hypothetical protein